MGMNFNFNDGPLPPSNVCEPHQPILVAIDKSGSMGDMPGVPKYAVFHNYIRGKRINKYQVLYWNGIYYSEEKLNKKMYEFLGEL